MIISPASRNGNNWSIKSSTGWPAFTSNMIFLGLFSFWASSWMEWAPTIFVPFASFSKNWVTFSVVRLYAQTTKPWSFIFRMRFWPITANPMSPISALDNEYVSESVSVRYIHELIFRSSCFAYTAFVILLFPNWFDILSRRRDDVETLLFKWIFSTGQFFLVLSLEIMSASAIPLNPKVLRDGPFLQRFWSFLKYQMNMNYDLFKYQINFHKPYQMLLFRFREQEQDIDKTWMIRSNKDFGGQYIQLLPFFCQLYYTMNM